MFQKSQVRRADRRHPLRDRNPGLRTGRQSLPGDGRADPRPPERRRPDVRSEARAAALCIAATAPELPARAAPLASRPRHTRLRRAADPRHQLPRREPGRHQHVPARHDGRGRSLAVSGRRQQPHPDLQQGVGLDRRRAERGHGRLLQFRAQRPGDERAARSLRPPLRPLVRHRHHLLRLALEQPRAHRRFEQRDDLARDDLDLLLLPAQPRSARRRHEPLPRLPDARRGRQRPRRRRQPVRHDGPLPGHERPRRPQEPGALGRRRRSRRRADPSSPTATSPARPTATGRIRPRASTTSPRPRPPNPG